jgi:hypothetical protein
MRNWLKQIWRALTAVEDPWAKEEAEYEEFLRQHPEINRERRLREAENALKSGLSREFVERIYPEIKDTPAPVNSERGPAS